MEDFLCIFFCIYCLLSVFAGFPPYSILHRARLIFIMCWQFHVGIRRKRSMDTASFVPMVTDVNVIAAIITFENCI